MEQEEDLKKTIINEYPRLSLYDKFTFICHPKVTCYNKCCSDVNIAITPYDIVRLKNKLKISSQEFLNKYTVSPFTKQQRLPVVLLKMNDDKDKTCQFVGENGCSVYQDRPWPCRMYPVGMASGKTEDNNYGEEFFFLLKEDICKGFDAKQEISIEEWMREQGVEEYNNIGNLFKEITLHKFFLDGKDLEPQQMEMYYMVCYNPDKFKEFIFNSSFLEKFEVDGGVLEKIKKDDIELMKFGFKWLKFCLFKEKTLSIKSKVREARQKEFS
ncbi:MAG: YkgJ family cysteine cluster protein [bacterium]